MALSLDQWHQRYQQQANWTKNLRQYLYSKLDIYKMKRILEVGCGTGVLLEELSLIAPFSLHGLDINQNSLYMAQDTVSTAQFSLGDAHFLPFHPDSFELSLCHFLLLWVTDPLQTISEMKRVTTHGGYVIALAEPDYGGRIDFPMELSEIAQWQAESLMIQGANPNIGRELRALFSCAGLSDIEVGVLGGQWNQETDKNDFELEWKVITSDLILANKSIDDVSKLKSIDLSARKIGQRILYVPTFYAFGVV